MKGVSTDQISWIEMVNFCCICGRRSEEDATTSFHRVPVVTTATTNQIRTLERRQAWLEAISHSGCTQICPTDRVCSRHFRNGENFDRCYGMLKWGSHRHLHTENMSVLGSSLMLKTKSPLMHAPEDAAELGVVWQLLPLVALWLCQSQEEASRFVLCRLHKE